MNAVPVVGEPLAYGIGFLVLVFVVFGGWFSEALATIAHEGGHYFVGTMLGFTKTEFEIGESGGGHVLFPDQSWPFSILVSFAGYAAPPLLGLGGAELIANGLAWSALWVALVLLLVAFLGATNALATVFIGFTLVVVGWAAIAGTPLVQAAVAVALVWYLLIAGFRDALTIPRGSERSDLAGLRDRTWLPKIFWHTVFTVLAGACLWFGGRALLGYA